MTDVLDLHRFMSITIAAGPGVLAPRAETELLGRTALDLLAETSAPLVIDMCCGSGNLGLAIADARTDTRVFLSDLTDQTTTQARENTKRLGLGDRVTVGQGDMFAGLATALDGQKADLIVCNPPYISTAKLEGDSAHLLESEPREAFDAGAYGIALHQRLITDAPLYLKSGGWLAFEFGVGQDRQVALLLKRSGAYGVPSFANNEQNVPRVAYTQLL
ncbi:HemK/PrmC family methyltransferase [Devosia sp. 2618]|uniref:N5-glutamine methyltransferase family protein n=1 Tax=Devosia sp. 2618 TaxID=3156454 RepID=UPI00339498C3